MSEFLLEVLDLVNEDLARTQISDRKYGGTFNLDRASKKTTDELGRGGFSSVRPDKADPHMVKKQSIVPLGRSHADKEDGFSVFVRMIAENGMMDNIHFPKVYKAQKITDANQTHRHHFTMEKLTPLESLEPEEIASVEEHHMTPGYNDELSIAERIYDACRSARARDTYIKMESLKEACEALDEMDDVSDFRIDIHDDNIMVRRTPHGLQLVISDPFGMVKAAWKHKYM